MSSIYMIPFGMGNININRPRLIITAEFTSTTIQRKRGRFYPALRQRAAV